MVLLWFRFDFRQAMVQHGRVPDQPSDFRLAEPSLRLGSGRSNSDHQCAKFILGRKAPEGHVLPLGPGSQLARRPRAVTQNVPVSVTPSIARPGVRVGRAQDVQAQSCPIPGCSWKGATLLEHALEFHLPRHYRKRVDLMSRPDGLKLLKAMKWICAKIGGTGTLSHQANKSVLRTITVPGEKSVTMRKICVFLGSVIGSNYPVPSVVSLRPLNSLLLLGHWKVALCVVSRLTPEERQVFRGLSYTIGPMCAQERTSLGASQQAGRVHPIPVSNASPMSRESPVNRRSQAVAPAGPRNVRLGNHLGTGKSKSKKGKVRSRSSTSTVGSNPVPSTSLVVPIMPVAESLTAQPTPMEVDGEEELAVVTEGLTSDEVIVIPTEPQPSTTSGHRCVSGSSDILPDGFDSHFHLDRLIKSEKHKRTSIKMMVKGKRRHPSIPFNLQGGVACFCDPESYPRIDLIDKMFDTQGFHLAIGIHPKKVTNVSETLLEQLRSLSKDPRVIAMGEVGLDYTSSVHIHSQKDVLGRFLTIVPRDKPVVFHIRPRSVEQEAISEAYSETLFEATKHLGKEQCIQLHSFSGGVLEVQQWISSFPKTFFSFSGLTSSFNEYQREGLRAVPLERLLLETDSPHLVVSGCDSEDPNKRVNNPCYLGSVAKVVADIRNTGSDLVLQRSYRNAIGLFNHPLKF
ncbi:hypothetical protein EGW08_012199 [Elysia chlorotica]|uniref:Uncharacterized protein n=1 Tax=Elysia chlorotica TaxID=188477 RepID=A0A3S1B502_ELYCH|nr:hypothetical protein EGW08_012199 [Elysia chlorotica]